MKRSAQEREGVEKPGGRQDNTLGWINHGAGGARKKKVIKK